MKKYLLFFLLLFFCASNAFAGNVDTYGIGSKATAMGGAFTAYADDPFAVYYNPAGLTQMKTEMFSLGLMVMNPNLQAKDFQVPALGIGPANFSDESPYLYVPHVGFATPIDDNVVFGIALYAPFGMDLEWPSNPARNPAAYNCYDAGIVREVVTPAIAYRYNDQWSFGLGVSFGRANDYAKLQSLGLAQQGFTAAEEVDMDDDFNYSFNVGVMYRPMDTVSVGVTYRSRTDTDYDGHLELAGLTAAEKANLNTLLKTASGGAMQGLTHYSYKVSMSSIDFPDQLQVGVRYQPHERLSLEADMVWTNWSIVKTETLKIEDRELQQALAILAGQKTPVTQIVTPRYWKDTKQVKLGIEWKATDLVTLRGGYFYDPTPIPDNTFDVVWADADKTTIAAGIGLNLAPWTIDGVVQYTNVEHERIIGGESVNLNDTYGQEVKVRADGEVWGFGLTFNYTF